MRVFFYLALASTLLCVGVARADNPWEPIAGLDESLDPVGMVVSYETTANKARLFHKETTGFSSQRPVLDSDVILTLDPAKTFQTVDGFGAAITGSTAVNLLSMPEDARQALLVETFSPTKGLGYSFVRVSIGCSDFSLSEFSLCDEPGIEHFALSPEDKEYVIPALKEILAINPGLKIMASPWTCPPWMKVNNLEELQPYPRWTSGQLNPKYYEDYATYFVRYLEAMRGEGIEIYAITMQNEPLNRGNSASLFMTWQEQKEFVKVLGPKLRDAGLDTIIMAFDHNFNYDSNKPECRDQFGYPLHIYEDEEAAQYLAGAAYHAYGGNKEEMKRVRDARPDKGLWFTEQSIGDWGYSFGGDLMWFMREVGIGVMNYDCKGIVVWNFLLDDQKGPNRPGGCQSCYGAANLSTTDHKSVERYSHFYEIGHFSKVVLPGAKRVAVGRRGPDAGFYACAFVNPDGSYALVTLNETDEPRAIRVRVKGGEEFVATLQAKGTCSFKWREPSGE